MASLYDPDEAAVLVQPLSEAFRTQRDVGLRVPINFLTVATTSLSAACFGNRQYEDAAFQKCFSNLLAAPFRRFLVDVYWDAGRSVWSLCPVEVPTSSVPMISSVTEAASSTASLDRRDVLSTNVILPPSLLGEPPGKRGFEGHARQESSVSKSASATISLVSSSAPITPASSRNVVIPTSVPLDDAENQSALLQIGNYNCTSTITLSWLASILDDFLVDTDTTTEASITYLTLNLHAAASYLAPNDPAQQPSTEKMPRSESLISDILKGNLSDQIYTPKKLQDSRNNLKDSWFDVSWDIQPALGYYQTSTDSSNNVVTQDGWPTGAYVQFKEYLRFIASFGSIDPQMLDYNLTADYDTIFPPDTISNLHSTAFNAAGEITSGCLFSGSAPPFTSSTNSSWAISMPPALSLGLDPNTTDPIPSITNLTSCGLSPFLNTTLSSTTADQNPAPYLAFARSAFWAWEPTQPSNASDPSSSSTANRCAAIHTTGRWHTIDCTAHQHAACQSPTNPYNWVLSTTPSTYTSPSCPPNTTFSVPHTPLENSHLLAAILAHSPPLTPVLLNLNALDVPECWVLSSNATCPYTPPADTSRTKVVVVPTVAAVIIFVLAALTFFVKCAANRREDVRGRGRRNVGGWEYEGVPS